ncbi:MAG: UDP-N-acetylmuramate dehydrogenase [Deferribacterota bacterium]|nr:UDP-N-acetylmuramate dehydrogenase [Deferribacterota bacterium]
MRALQKCTKKYKSIDFKNVTIFNDVDLSTYSTYKTGGVSKYFATPKNINELRDVLAFIRDNQLDYYFIGRGSNILFSDKYFDGIIVNLRKLNNWIYFNRDIYYIGAGVLLDDFIGFTTIFGFSKIIYLSGIPGTIGGATYMNAGAYGVEIGDFITHITVLDKYGRVFIVDNSKANFSYRNADGLKDYIILSVALKLSFESSCMNSLKIRDNILTRRASSQPLEYSSCGSVFKRGKDYCAGELIEKCGLKGYKLGGCEVSTKHCNFIVNKRNATSSDIYNLIKFVKKTVKAKFNIELEEEVKLVGF